MSEEKIIDDLKHILIVDDSEIDREILKQILVGEFRVTEEDNGYSALEIILKKKEHFDAILLDVSMPVLDGLNVLRILRENNVEDIPIFMITSEAAKDNIEKALQYNISEFIKKPFDKDEILKRVILKLGVSAKSGFADADIKEMRRYIDDLEAIYNPYLLAYFEAAYFLYCRNKPPYLSSQFENSQYLFPLQQTNTSPTKCPLKQPYVYYTLSPQQKK